MAGRRLAFMMLLRWDLQNFPPLDPFLEIDGIVIPTNDFNSTPQFPEKDHPDVISRDDGDDSEPEYELELEDGNAFDFIS